MRRAGTGGEGLAEDDAAGVAETHVGEVVDDETDGLAGDVGLEEVVFGLEYRTGGDSDVGDGLVVDEAGANLRRQCARHGEAQVHQHALTIRRPQGTPGE